MKKALFLVLAALMVFSMAHAESTLDSLSLPKIPDRGSMVFYHYTEGITDFYINILDGRDFMQKRGCMTDKGVVFAYGEWDGIASFSEGLSIVSRDEKYGAIDGTGAVVIEPVWDNLGTFKEGLASAGMNTEDGQSRYGYINAQGEMVIEASYEKANGFSNGYAAVKKDGLWGLIDHEGNAVLPCEWEFLGAFDGETIRARKDGLYGVIDLRGNTLIDFVWDTLGDADGYQGWRTAKKDGKAGYVDAQGNAVIDFRFDGTYKFDEFGYAIVIADGLRGVIDQNGSYTIEPQFEGYFYSAGENTAWARGSEDSNDWTLLSKDGKIFRTTDEIYSETVFEVHDGLMRYWAAVNEGFEYHSAGWGYMDTEGNVAIAPEWTAATDFSNGYAFVWDKEGKPHVIDTQGQIVK